MKLTRLAILVALLAAAVANEGMVPVPRLLADSSPATWRRAMSPATARELAAIMEYGVQQGWASSGAVPGVRVAGKTGSAELESGAPPHAVFIAFAPVEAPRIAVAVLKAARVNLIDDTRLPPERLIAIDRHGSALRCSRLGHT